MATSSIARRKVAARAGAARARKGRPVRKPSTLATSTAIAKGAVAGVVATLSNKLTGSSANPDAIALLERDHRRLESLLAEGNETTERAVKGRTTLLRTLTAALNVHELLEEKVLYPALEKHPEGRSIVLEGFEEHHVADLILKELQALRRSHEQWGAKFKVLKENIEHHIKEEERKMFPTARGLIDGETLQRMGAKMAAMKARADGGRRV
jgi:hypothetical protein